MTDYRTIAEEILAGSPLSIPESWEEISDEAAYRLLRDSLVGTVACETTDHADPRGFYTGWVGRVTVFKLLCGKLLVQLDKPYCGNCFDGKLVGFYLADEEAQ